MPQQDFTGEFHDPGRPVDGDLELVLTETAAFDSEKERVPMYRFEMRLIGTGTTVGRLALRTRCTPRLATYGGNLSYDVWEEHRGNRYAARGCRLLLPLARRHGLDSLWITYHANNVASRRTCERIGATYVDTIETEREPGEFGPTCRYRLDLDRGMNDQQGVD